MSAAPRKHVAGADLFLLKSRSDAALGLAAELETAGATVLNSHRATALCLDRLWSSVLLAEAGIASPRTVSLPAMSDATAATLSGMGVLFPLVVKSRRSRKGDLVAAVASQRELDSLRAAWAAEPVVLQEHIPSDGWDVKAWGIGDAVFLARRRSPLSVASGDEALPGDAAAACRAAAALAGAAFGLRLYGVDLLITPDGPVVIDVNAFPGFRSVPGADEHLAGLVAGVLEEGRA